MTYSLGVDLGTTTSAAALRRGSRLEVCALGDLTATMPSVALERADGSLLVGEAAADRALYDTTLVARHVTAHLDDGEPIALDGRLHDPARLTQGLLETVIDRVRRLYGDRPQDVVLTYPLFPPGGSPALLQRVGQAAVGGAQLIPHPVAAVAKLAHDVEIAVGTTIAVLDLGGGTFEVTIVRRSHDGFDVVGPPGGLADLGGVEFDDAVFARVDAELGHVLQGVPRDDVEGMAALRRLRVACRAAKEWLSSSPDTTVEVALPHLSTWVPIRRADLESDIRPALMAAVDVVAQTIAASELAPADVHVALLVGGSSRIPLFGELVASRLGLPIVADPFPELTVALGAALFGSDGPPPPPPPAGVAATRDDPGSGARDPRGGEPGDDVGALSAWFADPTGGPTHLPASAPGPGPAARWDDLPEGPPADNGSGDADAWDGGEWGAAEGDVTAWDGGEWGATEGDATGWGATEGDVTAWDGTDDDAWEPEWDAAGADDPGDTAAWHGGEWTESVGQWGDAVAAATVAAGRRAGPTTGETDLWGPPSRRRRGRGSDGDDEDDGPDTPSGEDQGEGTNTRLIAAVIGGALAIVGIAGVALATGMGGADDPQLTLADPARSAITTTTLATSTTEPPTTITTSTTTTTTEPEPESEWEPPPPPPSTEPPTTATTTTTAPPTTTTTARPTTTTTAPATTTTCPAGPPGPPGPPTTTTTTVGGCD
ncbi:MAG TPA: Hsp70 family protein [Acidimicrobiales bacterium]|nr:Hsp70 family protein [Acidimicrobiales bacterium]